MHEHDETPCFFCPVIVAPGCGAVMRVRAIEVRVCASCIAAGRQRVLSAVRRTLKKRTPLFFRAMQAVASVTKGVGEP